MLTDGRGQLAMAGKQGFIDRTGKIVIEARFDEARVFSEGLAAVRVGDKWGYVDPSGRMVIEPQFDMAVPFYDGLALVHMGSERREDRLHRQDRALVWKPTN